MTLIRRTLPLAAGLLLLLAPPACQRTGETRSDPALAAALAADMSPDALRCFAFGDWGTGSQGQLDVAASMADKARAGGLDLLLSTGDNFYPDGVLSADDPLWTERFADVYAAPELAVPLYAALGNHDHQGRPDAQVERTAVDDRWRMPARHYAFSRWLDDGTEIGFFVLDTTPITVEDPAVAEQLAWLDGALQASRARWKIAVGHHPLYSHGARTRYVRMIAALQDSFVRGGVDLYVAGHDHGLQLLRPSGRVTYVVSGAGGGADNDHEVSRGADTRYASTGGGFVALRISHARILIEFVLLEGRTDWLTTLEK